MRTIYRFPVDSGAIHVAGDPEMGDYEWEHRDDEGRLLACSHRGYGLPGAAMRDGLIHAIGAPLLDAARAVAAHYVAPVKGVGVTPLTGAKETEISAAWEELHAVLNGTYA
ncbi:MAG: hypothetical protein RL654_132 [Pseudomonadota bacterium]|jgi:hypothetical protein